MLTSDVDITSSTSVPFISLHSLMMETILCVCVHVCMYLCMLVHRLLISCVCHVLQLCAHVLETCVSDVCDCLFVYALTLFAKFQSSFFICLSHSFFLFLLCMPLCVGVLCAHSCFTSCAHILICNLCLVCSVLVGVHMHNSSMPSQPCPSPLSLALLLTKSCCVGCSVCLHDRARVPACVCIGVFLFQYF